MHTADFGVFVIVSFGRFKGELAEGCGATPILKRGSDHFDPDKPDNAGKQTSVFSYTAPCQIYLLETLYSQRTDALPGEDDRGQACGMRVHTLVFNRQFSPSKLMHAVQTESESMHRCGRATRCSNAKRKQGTERAAKQQRLAVADADVERSSMMKFAQASCPTPTNPWLGSNPWHACCCVLSDP